MSKIPATALQRLLKYPHAAVFDKSPASELALRIRHPDGARWTVADEVMTVTAGDVERIYPLSGLTFGALAAALEADGFEVPTLAPQWARCSALAAVEGAGDERESNGDHVYAFTSLLWALMSGYAVDTREAGRQVIEALRQMIMTQAEGEWLDLWGALYNVPRKAAEGDVGYAGRIPREAFRIRVNALAIELAIKDLTGKDVVIEEPWGDMFRLDVSQLSGGHKFYNGESVGYHIIRPVSREPIDWADVLAVIERNRAAGIVVLPPEVRYGRFIDASIDGTIWSGRSQNYAVFIPFVSDNRLDYLILSGEEITRNWLVMISSLLTYSNSDELENPYSISLRRTFSKASSVLSDGFRLGDENSVFPRSELTREGGAMQVSHNLELSAPEQKPVRKPVDFISTEIRAFDAMDTGGPVWFSGVKPSVIIGRFVDAQIDGAASFSLTQGFTWTEGGGWGDFQWGLSQSELMLLESAARKVSRYAQQTMHQHLWREGAVITAFSDGAVTSDGSYLSSGYPVS